MSKRCKCGLFAAKYCIYSKCRLCCNSCRIHTNEDDLCKCRRLKSSCCINDNCQLCCQNNINWDECNEHHWHFADGIYKNYNYELYLDNINMFKSKVTKVYDMMPELLNIILCYMRCRICYNRVTNK